ncbi:EARLY FLOWERING-like protein [Perilla frutescens var. hirtella]|nr:EARLY FLOWERING-like protein [Perilla frutescens var. hirtella]KAH6810525.1 EARLY FLOWERING-like protein [Perilla frutescens var. frutescens]
MDDTSNTLISAANHSFSDFIDGEDAEAEDDEEEDDDFCDVETWETLSRSFREVQSVLDRNRRLIQQVNDNHRSKMPHNLAKNVDLISEINANISKVVALYSNLSANLSTIVHQRRAAVEDSSVQKVES